MTREAIVIGPNGTEILDMDPVNLENNGDVASASDQALELVLDGIDDYYDEFGVDGLKLVWSDTHAMVMVECPSCDAIKAATQFGVCNEDDDFVMCTDCIND
jgi:hypothetical protein